MHDLDHRGIDLDDVDIRLRDTPLRTCSAETHSPFPPMNSVSIGERPAACARVRSAYSLLVAVFERVGSYRAPCSCESDDRASACGPDGPARRLEDLDAVVSDSSVAGRAIPPIAPPHAHSAKDGQDDDRRDAERRAWDDKTGRWPPPSAAARLRRSRRCARAQPRNQPEAGEERADDRADGRERINRPDGVAGALEVGQRQLHDDR